MPEQASKRFLLEFEKPLDELYQKIGELRKLTESSQIDLNEEISTMEARASELAERIYKNLKPYQIVQMARHPQRPTSLDIIALMSDSFIELHGDRLYGDDPSMIGGPAYLDGRIPVMFIGHQKGKDTKDNIFRNFGMANPEGYRKALRLMKMAEQFNMPIISLIDTPGAYPGLGAEERGQSEAIARNLMEMAMLKVPVIAVIIGEGGSGGALGIAVANRVYMLEHTVYSVISPEGCASILFRDSSKAQQASEALQMTAKDLLKQKIIEGIIDEPLGGAHTNLDICAASIKQMILKGLSELKNKNGEELVQHRLTKFRDFGAYAETKAAKTATPTES